MECDGAQTKIEANDSAKKVKTTSNTKGSKKLKLTEIVIVAILCIIVAIIFASSIDLSGIFESETTSTKNFEQYVLSLEKKVADIVGAIEGVGSASVAITFESGVEKIYAYETTTTSTGETKNDLMLYHGEPIVVKEISPQILGVVIVAKGAGSAVVRLNIVRTVQVLLGVSYEKIEVFTKN